MFKLHHCKRSIVVVPKYEKVCEAIIQVIKAVNSSSTRRIFVKFYGSRRFSHFSRRPLVPSRSRDFLTRLRKPLTRRKRITLAFSQSLRISRFIQQSSFSLQKKSDKPKFDLGGPKGLIRLVQRETYGGTPL